MTRKESAYEAIPYMPVMETLAELAGRPANSPDGSRELFEALLRELKAPMPSIESAVWTVLPRYIDPIAKGKVSGSKAIRKFINEIWSRYAYGFTSSGGKIGERFDLYALMSSFYEIDDLREHPPGNVAISKELAAEFSQRDSWALEREGEMVKEAQAWMAKHAPDY